MQCHIPGEWNPHLHYCKNLESCKLTQAIIQVFWKRRIFERPILRKIFGPVNTDNIWRIRNNTEIDKLIEGADMVSFIKTQRIK